LFCSSVEERQTTFGDGDPQGKDIHSVSVFVGDRRRRQEKTFFSGKKADSLFYESTFRACSRLKKNIPEHFFYRRTLAPATFLRGFADPKVPKKRHFCSAYKATTEQKTGLTFQCTEIKSFNCWCVRVCVCGQLVLTPYRIVAAGATLALALSFLCFRPSFVLRQRLLSLGTMHSPVWTRPAS
jgi:hypothetical protein